jgi:cytochrome b involved in lipid metabolism
LEKHVSVNDAWLSLDGEVYDVTQYLRYHPGGKKIMEGCGRECRELFSIFIPYLDKYHSWVNGKYLLQKFKVGNLGYDPSKPKFGASLK